MTTIQITALATCLGVALLTIGTGAQGDATQETKQTNETRKQIKEQSEDLERLAKLVRDLRNKLEREKNGDDND